MDKGKCHAVTPQRVYVSNYGPVSGVDAMKKELQNGPIGCGVAVTEKFEAYTGGIYEEETFTGINHEISLVG